MAIVMVSDPNLISVRKTYKSIASLKERTNFRDLGLDGDQH